MRSSHIKMEQLLTGEGPVHRPNRPFIFFMSRKIYTPYNERTLKGEIDMKKLIISVMAGLASIVHDLVEIRRAVKFISMAFGVEPEVTYDWSSNLMEAGLWMVVIFVALYIGELVLKNIVADLKWEMRKW